VALLDLLNGCTVRVENVTAKKTGTGFFVSPGQVITCRHTLEPGVDPEIRVTWKGHELSVERDDPPTLKLTDGGASEPLHSFAMEPTISTLDAVLLTVSCQDEALPPCVLLDVEVALGDRLYSFGYPRGRKVGFPYYMRALHPAEDGRLKLVQGQVENGLSGAPLLNLETGAVCGMLSDTIDPQSNLGGFALTTRFLLDAFPDLEEKNAEFHRTHEKWLRLRKKQSARLRPGDRRSDGAEERQAIRTITERVKEFWIDGVLAESRQVGAHLQLEYELRFDLISHPWKGQVKLPDRLRTLLPGEDSIQQVFRKYDQSLLILGGPGSGKTITLLELARDLLDRVEEEPLSGQPIPVVFHLASWKGPQQSIADWIVEELVVKYYIASRFGKSWLRRNRLLPLLDGLDEVRPGDRPACINSINQFSQNLLPPGIAICSRLTEYAESSIHLELKGAICLKPLSDEQLEYYFSSSAVNLAGLRSVILRDEALHELATCPLTLGIMAVTYTEAGRVPIEGSSTVRERREQIIESYVECMFDRRGDRPLDYSRQRVFSCLSWLAKSLKDNPRGIFMIESLQPSLLDTPQLKWVYSLFSRVPLGAMLALGGWTSRSVAAGCNGLFTSIIGSVKAGCQFTAPRIKWLSPRSDFLRFWCNYAFYLSLLLCFDVALFDPAAPDWGGLAAMWAAVGALIFEPLRRKVNQDNDVAPVELLEWSWWGTITGIRRGLLVGLVIGPAEAIVDYFKLSVTHGSLIEPMVAATRFPLVWFLGTVLYYLSSGAIYGIFVSAFLDAMKTKLNMTKVRPNEGMRSSLRNAFLGGICATIWCLTGVLIRTFLMGTTKEISWEPWRIVQFSVMIGFATWLYYGGFDAAKHYTLRLLLSLAGIVPLNLARFLDHAARLNLVRRAGGGYIFMHPLILDYFANVEVKNPSSERNHSSGSVSSNMPNNLS